MAQEFQKLRNERVESALADDPAALPSTQDTPPAPELTPSEEVPAPAATAAKAAPSHEELQAQLQSMRSEIGRINALNRLHQQDQQEIRRLREQVAQMGSRDPQAAQHPAKTTEKLEQVREKLKDFPELEGLVDAVTEAVQQVDTRAVERAEQAARMAVEPLEPLRIEREEQARQAAIESAKQEFKLLTDTYPTFSEVVKTPEFKAWVDVQAPAQVRDAFRNGQTPGEALVVLDTYNAFVQRNGGAPIASPKPNPSPERTPPRSLADKQERARMAAGFSGRPSGGNGGMPPEDDFESSLQFFRRQRLARQRA